MDEKYLLINVAELSKKIVCLRKQKGMSQGTLAESINISKSAMHSYEHGKTIPTLEAAINIAYVLDTSLGNLLDGCKIVATKRGEL